MHESTPPHFDDWTAAEAWLASVVKQHTAVSSRRDRRRHWEPFSIKMLRFKIREAASDHEKNSLSKQLFVARKNWFQQRESVFFRAQIAKGRNPSKGKALHPVTQLDGPGGIAHSPHELADAVSLEFERRWQACPDDVASPCHEAEFEEHEVPLTIDVLEKAARQLKRPWIRDCRGIPPAALLGGGKFFESALPALRSLLGRDAPWQGLEEHGYVKQKVLNGKTCDKLRGIIPNSTILRLLTFAVLDVLRPLADAYSVENGMSTQVLGASKGGQTLDIAHTAQLCLQCGRDNEDRAACGQMDIKNYHDSLSRSQMYQSQMRRNVPLVWACAALRLQRCPQVKLCVRSGVTAPILRSRGALTGNSLAPFFGRIVVEDVFLAAAPLLAPLHFSFMGLNLAPMAWSDNIIAFGPSARKVARALGTIAEFLHSRHLSVKPGSTEIVPACSRRFIWPDIAMKGLTFKVQEEMKSLGYWITCNGNAVRNRATMIGTLKGKLAIMDKRFSCVPELVRAKWWKLQFRGVVSYFACYLGVNRLILQKTRVLSNGGSRKVLRVGSNFNDSSTLTRVQNEFNICLSTFFCKSVVSYLGHCFRHADHPITKLMSLPLQERLADLRLQGRRSVPSGTAQAHFNSLVDLGVNLGQLISGRPAIRGHSGHAIRWGKGWFEELRDGGLGWSFEKTDAAAVDTRVQFLLNLFLPVSRLPRLQDQHDHFLALPF